MPLLPAYLLMAQAARIPGASAEFALRYRRPSAVVAQFGERFGRLGATLVPHDDRSTVEIVGAPAEVETARRALSLADVPRKPILLRVTVESPADHLTWEVDARLSNGQKWRTADEETGTEIALEPHVDANGVLTVRVFLRCARNEITSLFRLKKGSAQALEIGSHYTESVEVAGSDVKVAGTDVPLPKVVVRYVAG